jgi:hypothetical protein
VGVRPDLLDVLGRQMSSRGQRHAVCGHLQQVGPDEAYDGRADGLVRLPELLGDGCRSAAFGRHGGEDQQLGLSHVRLAPHAGQTNGDEPASFVNPPDRFRTDPNCTPGNVRAQRHPLKATYTTKCLRRLLVGSIMMLLMSRAHGGPRPPPLCGRFPTAKVEQ